MHERIDFGLLDFDVYWVCIGKPVINKFSFGKRLSTICRSNRCFINVADVNNVIGTEIPPNDYKEIFDFMLLSAAY